MTEERHGYAWEKDDTHGDETTPQFVEPAKPIPGPTSEVEKMPEESDKEEDTSPSMEQVEKVSDDDYLAVDQTDDFRNPSK